MEDLNHFSHGEHPLFLIEDVHQIAAAPEEPICYGCGISIKSELEEEPTYGCRECSSFFLHKRCAELPREISHQLHPKHPLVLLPRSIDRFCDSCYQECWRFTYTCSSCDLYIDISCIESEIDILHAFAESRIDHPGHHHPLALQRRQASFICNACGEKDIDQSYLCTTCSFWIHRKCAVLPGENRREDHEHPFLLAYNLPMEYARYGFECYVCRKLLHLPRWVYICRPCRYFVHVKCFTKDIQLDRIRGTHADSDAEVTKDLIRLPAYNFNIIIRQFVKQQERKNGHLLIHCFSQNEDDKKQHLPRIHRNLKSTAETMVPEQEIICDCCIQSIDLSRLFYECGKCKYFFHSTCLGLPVTIDQPPLHPEHSLKLLKLAESASAFSFCQVCYYSSNGAFYGCKRCDFRVDITCASLPTVIAHEAHRHTLYFEICEPERCSACDYDSRFLFRCEGCKFNLDYGCAQLPQNVKHRWDRHTLTLSFPPFSDHPDEFWCAMCEREIHPNLWLYHCRECDTSFHPYCINLDRKVKFGRTITVGNHPQHPLLLVREPSFYSSCDNCHKDLNNRISFMCKSCKFYLCRDCAGKNEIILDRKSCDCSTSKDQD